MYLNATEVSNHINRQFGVHFKVECFEEKYRTYLLLIPLDLDRTEGFLCKILVGWRSITAEFLPGNYAANLVSTMGMADEMKREAFYSFLALIESKNGDIKIKMNKKIVNPYDMSIWSVKWSTLKMSVAYVPISVENVVEHIKDACTHIIGLVLSLLPLEMKSPAQLDISRGYPEGEKYSITLNRYERHQRNRILCVNSKGCTCAVCDLNFEEKYGEIGFGFIHVHHIVPVSQLSEDYIIDPIKDLEPVCPNCHAMIHTQDPPISISKMKKLISETQSKIDNSIKY